MLPLAQFKIVVRAGAERIILASVCQSFVSHGGTAAMGLRGLFALISVDIPVQVITACDMLVEHAEL